MPFLAPIFAGIGAAVSTVGGIIAAGGIGGTLLRIGGSILLSSIGQKMQQSKLRSQLAGSTALSGATGDGFWRDKTVAAPAQPVELIYGRVRKAGTITFWQDEGAVRYLVVTLAYHQIAGIDEIYFDGELAVNAAGAPVGRFVGFVEVEKTFGAADASAFPTMRARIPGLWTPAHRMQGVAGLALTLRFDASVYPNGTPNVTAIVRGKNDILDPRTGLRGWSNNAALCVADYMALDTRLSIGAAIGAEDGINTASLIEAANICDEVVPTVGGTGTEPRYALDGIVTLNVQPQTIIDRMLTAMAGNVAFIGGQAHILAGAYRIPVMDLTLDDARGSISGQSRITMAENCNGVRGKFRSPENDWQPDDFPPYRSAVYLAEDGGEERWRDIELPFTLSASAAQRLAKIELERVRRQISETFPAKMRALAVAAGDVVTRTDPLMGWAAKPFEIVSMSIEIQRDGRGAPMIVPELVLRETSPLIYDWSATEEQIYAAAPRTALASGFDLPAPGVPQVTEALYETRDGTQVKAKVRLDWVPTSSPFVAQYQVEARVQGATVWQDFGRTTDAFIELFDWTPGLWEFRVAAVTRLGIFSPWATRSAEVYGLGAPPAMLEGLTIQTAGGLAILKWTRSPDADVRNGGSIVIRHSAEAAPTWATSYSMDRVNGNEAIAIVPLKPGTYLLRAEDSSGQQGPVVMVATKGAQAVAFASVATIQADPTFPGAVTGAAAVVDGQLTLAGTLPIDQWPNIDTVDSWDNFGGVGTEGIYAFGAGMDFGTVRRVRLRSDISMFTNNALDRIDSRTANVDQWLSFDGVDGGEADIVVEYRETDDDPAGSPVWSGWSRVDSHEIEARAVQARAILTTRDPAFTPRVTRLRVHADEVI